MSSHSKAGTLHESVVKWAVSNKAVTGPLLFSTSFVALGWLAEYIGWATWGGIFGALAVFFFVSTIFILLFIKILAYVSG